MANSSIDVSINSVGVESHLPPFYKDQLKGQWRVRYPSNSTSSAADFKAPSGCSTPQAQSENSYFVDKKKKRAFNKKINKQIKQELRNQCNEQKLFYNDHKDDRSAELKAVTKEKAPPADYLVHEDELDISFKYRSKANLSSFVKRAYEVASYLSFLGVLDGVGEAIERAGLNDVFTNGCLVGCVRYAHLLPTDKPNKEKKGN